MTKPGEIRADSLYTLDEPMARLRSGKAALRQARREELIVKRIGRRSYGRGRDAVERFRRSPKEI